MKKRNSPTTAAAAAVELTASTRRAVEAAATADEARRAVIPEAIPEATTEAARLAAIDAAQSPEAIAQAEATAAALEEAADKADTAATLATLEYKEAKAAEKEAPAAEKEAATEARRAAYTAARKARAAARIASDKATEARAFAVFEATRAARWKRGESVVTITRYTTAADIAAREARAAYAKAEADEATDTATRERLKAAAKQADEAAKAAAEAAPRLIFWYGVEVDTRHPARALSIAHRLTAAALAILAPLARFGFEKSAAYINPFDTDEATEAAARSIARRAAKNLVQKQGTPTQWDIYFAAISDEEHHPDFDEMIGEARAAIIEARAPEAAARATLAAVDEARRAADYISEHKHRPEARAACIAALTPAAAALVTDSPRAICRRADKAEAAARAALLPRDTRDTAALHIAATARAAYRAINSYLSDCRAVHADTRDIVSLDEIAEIIAAPLENTEAATAYKARQAAIIRAAKPLFLARLTPAQGEIFRALYVSGGEAKRAAKRLHKDDKTVREHRAALASVWRDCVIEAAPDSIEAEAAKVEAEAAKMEAEAAKTAKRARAAKRAKDKAAAPISEAADNFLHTLPAATAEAAALIARGTSYEEAAAALNKSKATIREHKARAEARTRAALIEAGREVPEAATLAEMLLMF